MDAVRCECADLHSIEGLLYSYCHLVDTGQPEAVAELFVQNPSVDYGVFAADPIRSRQELSAYLRAGLAPYTATQHRVANPLIKFVDPANATGVTYMQSWQQCRDGGPDRECWGRYEDRFVRADDGWLISARRLVVVARRGYDSDPSASLPRREPVGSDH